MAENFKKKIDIQSLIDGIRADLMTYREKLKNKTFSQQDLQSLKTKAKTYFEQKEYYEVSVANIQKASSGLHFDLWKLAQTPWHALLDIGKAFGYGKTNSWRERIGYGLGGFYVTG